MLKNMLIRDWMSSPVATVTPETAIGTAHQTMKQKSIRRLAVIENDALVGIITIGDVREASPSDANTLSIWELNYLWAQLTVEKVMTRQVMTLKTDDEMTDAAKIMLDNKISGIPIVNDQKQPVGMVTEADVFRMVVQLADRVDMPGN